MYERHDGVYMLHKKIEACWNQMKVAGACRSELISGEHAVWLLVPVDVRHDRMPWVLCGGSSSAVGYPLIDSGGFEMSIWLQ